MYIKWDFAVKYVRLRPKKVVIMHDIETFLIPCPLRQELTQELMCRQRYRMQSSYLRTHLLRCTCNKYQTKIDKM